MQKPKANKYPSVKTISDAQRIGMVKEIFSTITGKYDFLNHLLSLRRDVAWRRFAIKKMRFFRTNMFLDVACGTGDLSINACLKHRHIKAVGVDFVFPMVKAGKDKVKKKVLSSQLNFMQGNALRIPFRDNTFDVTGMAFGIRNIPDRTEALREMLRVTAPGGQIMVLEMTFIENHFFKLFYYIYLNYLLPLMAKMFSKNAAAYYYLADSIMNFPSPDAFAKIMQDTGMSEVKIYPLTFGITCLYIGKKPEETDLKAS
jgi:demethylmenaquinone methyltransferase/2-methoxy-6-polyprenyl-1,4-benzoquinol methylase